VIESLQGNEASEPPCKESKIRGGLSGWWLPPNRCQSAAVEFRFAAVPRGGSV
jgi:hypothetical protein